MDRWAGRVALVTGSSSGIGEALVRELAKQGMKVVACARNLEKLQVNFTRTGIKPYPAKVIYLNFHQLEVVSRYRDPQLQVGENH